MNLYISPDRREEFLKVLTNNQKGTLNTEDLCLHYTWGESVDEPNTFYFHEAYIGKEGFEYHTRTKHFAEWEKFASSDPTPFTKAPEVVFFKTLTDDSLSKRTKAKQFISKIKSGVRAIPGALKAGVMSILRYDYAAALNHIAYEWFLFFEQFDPNPVTEEGKKRKAIREARDRGEDVPNEQVNVMPSFLAW